MAAPSGATSFTVTDSRADSVAAAVTEYDSMIAPSLPIRFATESSRDHSVSEAP